MNKNIGLAAVVILICLSALNNLYAEDKKNSRREKLLLDSGWKFQLGDASDSNNDFNYGNGASFAKAGETAGPAKPNFNDISWRNVDLPHDWAVELEFVNAADEDLKNHGYKPLGRKFPKTTVGWYRRAFPVPGGDKGRRFSVRFDGVFRDCIVWFNGHFIGRNLSGYSEFSFDVTDYIRYDQKNVLAVRVDASQSEGWFYEGAGIYRHVWLLKSDPLHIPEYGLFVRSVVGDESAEIRIDTDILNESDRPIECELTSLVLDQNGETVGKTVTSGMPVAGFGKLSVPHKISIQDPKLWSIESPFLHRLVSLVKVGGRIYDSVSTVFGIRTVKFDKDKGFFLNGKPVKIKGVCCHQDHAGVGSALPDRLQYYRIEELKKMGCNAYRSSHNPPARELLEACDALGMLVMDENRLMGSAPEMTSQFEKLILRDRNHPSVIIWSMGNEEYLIQNNDIGKNIASSLLRRQKELDPTRLCTYAANNGNQYEGINSVVPVRGFNYMQISDIDQYRKDHPDQILLGSEEASTLCTRGIYTNDTVRGYVSDYDINKPGWGSTAEKWWKFFADREWLAGGFVWTGFDYRGEPTPYGWPCINSHFGIMDVCGYPKNNYYYYQSWWTEKDVLHLFPHWNWKAGDTINVWCHSNCDNVELFLNGKSLGIKQVEKYSHLEWKVPYQKGTLEARGTKNGRLNIQKIETTSGPVKIILEPDRPGILADGEDVCVVNVSAQDDKGRPVPDAQNLIRFSLSGEGEIIGVGNGDPSSHEPDKYPDGGYQRRLFNGRCQVILRSVRNSGTIKLDASSDGLRPAELIVSADPCVPRQAAEVFEIKTVNHIGFQKDVEYLNEYSSRYTGGGRSALTDGVLATNDFKDGLWQGFEKTDFEFIIDLKHAQKISSLESRYLQDIESWIFLPLRVEYSVSLDKNEFQFIGRMENDVAADKPGSFIKSFELRFAPVTARYVRVNGKNVGLCPAWHKGAGGNAFVFVDEVIVK